MCSVASIMEMPFLSEDMIDGMIPRGRCESTIDNLIHSESITSNNIHPTTVPAVRFYYVRCAKLSKTHVENDPATIADISKPKNQNVVVEKSLPMILDLTKPPSGKTANILLENDNIYPTTVPAVRFYYVGRKYDSCKDHTDGSTSIPKQGEDAQSNCAVIACDPRSASQLSAQELIKTTEALALCEQSGRSPSYGQEDPTPRYVNSNAPINNILEGDDALPAGFRQHYKAFTITSCIPDNPECSLAPFRQRFRKTTSLHILSMPKSLHPNIFLLIGANPEKEVHLFGAYDADKKSFIPTTESQSPTNTQHNDDDMVSEAIFFCVRVMGCIVYWACFVAIKLIIFLAKLSFACITAAYGYMNE